MSDSSYGQPCFSGAFKSSSKDLKDIQKNLQNEIFLLPKNCVLVYVQLIYGQVYVPILYEILEWAMKEE